MPTSIASLVSKVWGRPRALHTFHVGYLFLDLRNTFCTNAVRDHSVGNRPHIYNDAAPAADSLQRRPSSQHIGICDSQLLSLNLYRSSDRLRPTRSVRRRPTAVRIGRTIRIVLPQRCSWRRHRPRQPLDEARGSSSPSREPPLWVPLVPRSASGVRAPEPAAWAGWQACGLCVGRPFSLLALSFSCASLLACCRVYAQRRPS